MTRKFILPMMLAAAAFSSCSTTDTDSPAVGGNPAEVKLSFSTGKMTRTPSATITDESTINNFTAGFYTGSAAAGSLVNVQDESSYTAGQSISTATTAGQICVAANRGAAGQFAGKSTRSDFEAVSVDLSTTTDDKTAANSQKSDALPMYGHKEFTFSDNVAAVTVPMYRLASKVQLTQPTVSFTGTAYAGATFVPKEVFLYNANTTCTYAAAGSNPLSGEITTYDAAGGTWSKNTSDYAYLSSGEITTAAWPYTFYTFPHTASSPTRIVVKGLYTDPSGNKSVMYYPIVVNKYLKDFSVIKVDGKDLTSPAADDSQISQNSAYTVNLTIKGVGVDSPSKDLATPSAVVTISVQAWTSYTQDVTIQ